MSMKSIVIVLRIIKYHCYYFYLLRDAILLYVKHLLVSSQKPAIDKYKSYLKIAERLEYILNIIDNRHRKVEFYNFSF